MVRCSWVACPFILLVSAAAAAAEFPSKPIRVIVPWPAGGSSDAIARVIGQRHSVIAKQPVVVDNRGGMAGTIGANMASKANPDGYTLLTIEGAHVVMPATTAGLGYDLARDFAPLTMVGVSPFVLFVHGALPAKSLNDFIATAKAKPGLVPAAHTGVGSLTHLTLEMLQSHTGVKFNHVSYKGAAPAVIDLAAGEVHLYTATYASGAPMVRTGRVRVMAAAAEKRMAVVPDVPTLNELGVPMVVTQWVAYLVPAKVPAAIQARLRKDLVAAIEDASVRERLSELAIDVGTSTPEHVRAHIAAELKRWAEVARAAGLKPQ